MLDKIKVTKEKIIPLKGGNVLHGIHNKSNGFKEFGEVYFSYIDKNVIKGWKKHFEMHMNIVVPLGLVKFVFFDENDFWSISLGKKNYKRISVPPGIWFSFKGYFDTNMVVNLASIPHKQEEQETKPLTEIKYW